MPHSINSFSNPHNLSANPDNDTELTQLVNHLSFDDLNILLYRSEPEELDSAYSSGGVYDVPGYGKLPYSGLCGFWNLIRDLLKHEHDKNHWNSLKENLRQGEWAMWYCSDRLCRIKNKPHLVKLGEWMATRWRDKTQERPLIFALTVKQILEKCLARIRAQFNLPVEGHYHHFILQLAMGVIQMLGVVKSTNLNASSTFIPSLAAGLPHFATYHMRSWGRDTFIAFHGFFLCTGLFDQGLEHLISYAQCCFNGLIPNLLDAQRFPRFNARDSTWWWLKAILDYIEVTGSQIDILEKQIERRFPVSKVNSSYSYEYCDWDSPKAYSMTTSLRQVIEEILICHWQGINFREPRAGSALDPVMCSEGFHIRIFTDAQTGLVYGGNQWNAGTWMDKMGSSERAGNRGIPSTPRHGAPIEINAIVFQCLTKMNKLGVRFSQKVVDIDIWQKRIKESFERAYWIPDKKYYRDYLLSPIIVLPIGEKDDNVGMEQLRPNFLIAMAEAPNLFHPEHARQALKTAERNLLGPFGIKTLSPSDLCYRPNYNVGIDSDDPTIALGANYHQGPEWLWLTPKYLQASCHFKNFSETTLIEEPLLRNLNKMLDESEWQGLPELTNRDGAKCYDSCPTQAWSMACLLEFLLRDRKGVKMMNRERA